MSGPVPRLELSDPGLFAGYDPRSVERGIRYAADGRVELIDVGDGWATADVAGTRPTPYEVDISWSVTARGVSVADDCTCPLGGSCKHAVAVIVEVARHTNASVGIAGGSRRSTSAAGLAASRPGPTWRSAFDRLRSDDASERSTLALQFTVSRPRATTYDPAPAAQVHLRPMRPGAKGKWVKSGAGWREVTSGYAWELRSADPEQLAAIQRLAAGYRELSYSSGSTAVPLERFGPGAWPVLRAAVEAGVTLIDGRGEETVTLASDPATLAVDMVATDDGLAVSTGFVPGAGTEVHGEDQLFTIGRPPHGLYTVHDTRLELIPLDRPVPAALAELIGGPPVTVPGSDLDEFLDDVHPRLARIATVGSSDGSVSVDPIELDGLVVRVDHHAVDAARLEWWVRYRRGERTSSFPLRHPGGATRDRSAERALAQGVELPTDLLDGLVDVSGRPADVSVHGPDAVTLLTQVVPWLLDRGQVDVELRGDAPELREASQDPLIALNVTDPDASDGSGTDWFDLSVDVSIDGEPIEFASLFTALATGASVLILPSGTWLNLDRPELDRLRNLIDEARGLLEVDDSGSIRLNPFQTDWWEELASLGVVESQSRRWADNVARMQALSAPEPVDPPAGLAAELRHYQQDGLDWLAFLHRNRLGGILADDMGLGKTVQTLGLFLHVLDQDPDARFLVVAPTTVVANWHRETDRFAPGVEVVTIRETEARRGTSLTEAVGDARIVVTSYALFRLEFDQYRSIDWEMLVLDEAQFVKNHTSKTYQCVRRLEATTKLAITGTPIENSLMDLWSLLSIVAPGLYPDPRRFSEVYRKPIESGRAPDRLDTLRRRVTPLMRRRTKDEVLTELPPKVEQTVDVELSARHMRIYQTQLQQQRKKVLGLVGDVQRHRFEIFKSLTILRQLSLDPGLIDAEHDAVGSAKLDRLLEDLTQVVAEGHRALVFSTFTRFLTRVKARLDDAGIGYAYLDGRTRNRERPIAAFKDGDVPVFVISLKAGGFGLNLTEADYCFVLDPWWNPAAETQAVDRAHRIGQDNTVVVYRYVSTGTIEEKVMELKARKAALFSSVMDADDALTGALDANDIRALIDLPS